MRSATVKTDDLPAVVKTVVLRRAASDAFDIFTKEIGAWWPLATHTRAITAQGQVTTHVAIEPRVGGRVYETLSDGQELEWGEVLTFSPGVLLELHWRMGRPAEQSTHVSVRFEPLSVSVCRVTLTHTHWERLGADIARIRDGYDQGWVVVFEEGYARYAGLA
jgi:uncharacterized protein YndB with AHSA1/START domain